MINLIRMICRGVRRMLISDAQRKFEDNKAVLLFDIESCKTRVLQAISADITSERIKLSSLMFLGQLVVLTCEAERASDKKEVAILFARYSAEYSNYTCKCTDITAAETLAWLRVTRKEAGDGAILYN